MAIEKSLKNVKEEHAVQQSASLKTSNRRLILTERIDSAKNKHETVII